MKKSRRPYVELNIYPQRWRLIGTLVLCLVALVIVADQVISIFLSSPGIGEIILFALLLALCIVYLLGFVWSALRLLISGSAALSSGADGLTLRGLPFLGTITMPWSEIKSIHTYRYLFLRYLCIVPQDTRKLVNHYGLLRFTLNISSRFSLRTGAPLNVSQGLLTEPVAEIARLLKRKEAQEETISDSSS